MPVITRWFKVSHDINADPEVWELTDTFGDRALRVWIEMLSIADRNRGLVGPDSDYTRIAVASKSRMSRVKVRLIFDWCLIKVWLVSDNGLRIAKWAKYNRRREIDQIPRGKPTVPLLDNTLLDNTLLDNTDHLKEDTHVNSARLTSFAEDWNRDFADRLATVRLPLSESRKRKLRLRLHEHPEEDFWDTVFTNIGRSKFLNGNGSQGWKCTFDFIIENDTNCVRIAEGQYAEGKTR